MLISLKMKNFRSIREEVVFSLEGEKRCRNDFQNNSTTIHKTELLHSAILFGRNSSGKSNLLKAFQVIQNLVKNSDQFKHEMTLSDYRPFLFDIDFQAQDSELEIVFIENKIRYFYSIKFNKTEFSFESLYFAEKNTKSKLYERNGQSISFGENFKGDKKTLQEELLPNQLILSVMAKKNIPYLKEAYLFLVHKLTFLNFPLDDLLNNLVVLEMIKSEPTLYLKLKQLLKSADTNILDFKVEEKDLRKFKETSQLPKGFLNFFLLSNKFTTKTSHTLFQADQEIGVQELPFEEESEGTQKLLILGGAILVALSFGHVVIVDELDKSLHPLLTKHLINLFHSKTNNPNSAQLIFTSHDSSLLDNNLFRRDQILLVEKEYKGNTKLNRLSDFAGVRKNVPFDKWYLSGKFRSVPVIDKSVQFNNETL